MSGGELYFKNKFYSGRTGVGRSFYILIFSSLKSVRSSEQCIGKAGIWIRRISRRQRADPDPGIDRVAVDQGLPRAEDEGVVVRDLPQEYRSEYKSK